MPENQTPVVDVDSLSIHELRDIAERSLRHRARLREARRGYRHSPEARANISKGISAWWAKRRAAETDVTTKTDKAMRP